MRLVPYFATNRFGVWTRSTTNYDCASSLQRMNLGLTQQMPFPRVPLLQVQDVFYLF